MNDNERHNYLISAICHGESRLAELDKERQRILAELKTLKAEFLKFSNSAPDITKAQLLLMISSLKYQDPFSHSISRSCQ